MKKFNLSWTLDGIQMSECLDSREDILKYNDGSVRVTIPNEVLTGTSLSLDLANDINISAYLESLDDLMVVAQIVDIIRRNTRVVPQINLQITSPMYSRYDRVMHKEKNDGFGASTFVKFIKATGVDSVELYDPHSDTLGKLLDLHGLSVTQIPQSKLLRQTIGIKEYIRVYPDKGSLKKQDPLHAYAPVIFNKLRDAESGRITGISCVEGQGTLTIEQDAPFLIVDDICEGGGTFLGVAKEFWKLSHSANELQLHVTHGLFTNNAISRLIEDGMFSKISAYIMKESTYLEIPDEYKSRVEVKHLVVGV